MTPGAVTAAAIAIHDADCPDKTCNGSALGHCYKLANAALEAAAPLIGADLGRMIAAAVADERERIRQLAFQHGALCNREPGTIFRGRVPPDVLVDGIMTFAGLLDQLEAKSDA